MQSRVASAAEAVANILVGFGINLSANLIVLPMFGFDVTLGDAFGIGLVFTVISLARSYALRRWFNGLKFGRVAPPIPAGYEECVDHPEWMRHAPIRKTDSPK